MGCSMKSNAPIVLLAVWLAAMAPAQKKPKQTSLPAVLNQAQYVYVEAIDGGVMNPNLYPEDRQAIVDVENALREWKRYTITIERSQADLVFVVRKGRRASAQASAGIIRGPVPPGSQTPGQQPANGSVIGAGGEVGPADDLLWVCMRNPDGTLSNPLWGHTQSDGLESPDVPLFRQFKRAMDRAYPPHPAGKKKP